MDEPSKAVRIWAGEEASNSAEPRGAGVRSSAEEGSNSAEPRAVHGRNSAQEGSNSAEVEEVVNEEPARFRARGGAVMRGATAVAVRRVGRA